MRRLVLGAVLLIVACGGVATLPTPSQSATRSGTPVPTIDVSDMMGGFPAATFFTVTDDGNVNAVALLNHALKYKIDAITPQIATANNLIYVADEDKNGARLRGIDQASGTVLATRLEPGRKLFPTGIGHGGIAVESTTGRVLVLYLDGDRRVLEAYEPYSLRPLGRRLESSCGDRVLVGAGRVVVPCFAAGTLVVKNDGTSDTQVVNAGLGPLVAAAMSSDGTTLVGRDDGTLGRVPAQSTTIEKVQPFRPATLVPDGIASPESGKFVVALSTTDREIGVSETRSSQRYLSFPAQQAPRGGVLAQGQFAFWITALGEARHIDLLQGFHETMVTFGGRVLPGGVGQ